MQKDNSQFRNTISFIEKLFLNVNYKFNAKNLYYYCFDSVIIC